MLGLFLQGVTWISLSASVLSNVSVDNTLEMSKHFPSDLDLCTVACTMSQNAPTSSNFMLSPIADQPIGFVKFCFCWFVWCFYLFMFLFFLCYVFYFGPQHYMFGFCLVTTCLTSYTPVSCAFSRFSFFLSVSLLCVHVPPVGDCPLASLFPVQLSHVWTLPPACHLLGLLAFMFLN